MDVMIVVMMGKGSSNVSTVVTFRTRELGCTYELEPPKFRPGP